MSSAAVPTSCLARQHDEGQMATSTFEPLKITCWPRVGIECDVYLPIDGILHFAAMRWRYGPQLVTTPGHVPDMEAVELPLARRGEEDTWYYAASFAVWGPHADYDSFWVKQFDHKTADLIDFNGRRGKVVIEKGRYKSYHMPTFLRHALWVSWYVVGDKAGIEALLAPMLHVGKKTAQGNGRLNGWAVEAWPEDWSVYGPNGRLMRAVPAADDPAAVLYGVRPSYWLPENQMPCRLPPSASAQE